MRSAAAYLALVATAILALGLPVALAHGGGGDGADTDGARGMDMSGGSGDGTSAVSHPSSYFSHPDHAGIAYSHIAVMVVSWLFVLPVAVMLSLARSRYTLAAQFVFLAANAVGVVLGFAYNANTPDLYPNNAHHKLGWIATCVVCAQVAVGLVGRLAGAMGGAPKRHRNQEHKGSERQSFIPVSTAAMAEHERLSKARFPPQSSPYRLSNDSGQGTEPRTESLRRSHSISTAVEESSSVPLHDHREGEEEEEEDVDLAPAGPHGWALARFAAKLGGMVSSKVWKALIFGYGLVDRTILLLGFVTLATGIATFGRFFEGHEVFSGLAHWIKGGIFFWFGVLTIGRWAGCFGEVGWAWNLRPKQVGQKWRPTAEFVESAVIFTYGATNIFLEHLGNWGKEWSSEDLEHISLTVLFIGGGLCGMLIESTHIRDLLNTTVADAALSYPEHRYSDEEREALRPPRQYEFSMNPLPALVILLVGIMMSSHMQTTMLGSMIHKQWGNLLAGASLARGLTYAVLFVRPPRSVLPGRPPTELLTAFGLMAGGLIFMASSSDTVDAMVGLDVDEMFVYTCTMGVVGVAMAWCILLVALKGWAVRRETGRPRSAYEKLA